MTGWQNARRMDPLTHTLAGAALREGGVGRGTRYAGAALLIGANLPDIDALSYFAGSDAGLALRRGVTHGILALVLWPPLLTALLLVWDRLARAARGARGAERPLRRGPLLLAAATGVASHPFLDWLNTYGIRLLMPFDGRWFYGDALFIVDPWLWLVLGGSVMLARAGREPRSWIWAWIILAALMSLPVLRSGLVGPGGKALWITGLGALAVLRAGTPPARPHALARIGLALAAVYVTLLVCTSMALKSWALEELRRQGLSPIEDVMIGPMPANPFGWEIVLESRGVYRTGTVHPLPTPRLRLRDRILPIDPDPARVRAARRSPCIAGALNWMRFPFAEVERTATGAVVHFIDARYARGRERGFGVASVELDLNLVPRDCGRD